MLLLRIVPSVQRFCVLSGECIRGELSRTEKNVRNVTELESRQNKNDEYMAFGLFLPKCQNKHV